MLPVSQSIGVLTAAALVAAGAPISPAANKVLEPKPPVNITASLTEASPTLRQVNRGTFEVALTIENTDNGDLVLWPFLAVQVLDAKGRPVARSQNIGRWGDRNAPSVLEEIPFVELQPGKALEIQVQLHRYLHDAEAITGWQLPGSGNYQLVLRYKYDRTTTKKKYGAGCKMINDPDRPWNRAVEVDKTTKVKLAVRE
jgi:hypothetical protein